MFKQYIGGEIVDGKGKPFDVISPATDKVVGTVSGADASQAIEAIEAAKAAFKGWSGLSINQRTAWVKKLRDAIEAESDRIVELTSLEIGKPVAQSRGEMAFLLDCLDFYPKEAASMTGEILPDFAAKSGDALHMIRYDPLGVAVGHLAWNFPLQNAGLKIGPALASGCTLVLKPSSKSPMGALYIGEIANKIGLPAGVLNVVSGPSNVVAKALNESKIPRLISLIGSSETGRQIMGEAATNIKQFSFELGGNAPCIIAPDTDIDEVAKFTVTRKSRFTGQGCGNINRVIVHESVHEEYVAKVHENLKKLRVGWSLEDTDANLMGPMIDKDARARMFALIKDAVDKGATLVFGGDIPADKPEGAFINMALVDNVTAEMDLVDTEIFGPIIAVMTYNDIDEAIERANKTTYGLGSYLFTHDYRIIAKCAEQLEFGEVLVNAPASAINLPHVGIKESGIGCDNGKYSLREYYNMRRISIRP